ESVQGVTTLVHPRRPVTERQPGRHWILGGICGVIFSGLLAVGLAVNATHYWHLVRDGSYLFTSLGAIIDLAAVSLLSAGAVLWRDGHWGAAVGSFLTWLIFAPLSVIPTAADAAQVLADRAAARGAGIVQSADRRPQRLEKIASSKMAVAAAMVARDQECGKVGPNCRQRVAELNARQAELTAALDVPIVARASVAAADPGPAMLASLFSWAGVTEKLIQQAWVAGLTIVPALAGVFMMFTTLLLGRRR